MARATPDQLVNLPGFGQVKVKNIKNAFDKPFHNQATSSITVSHSEKQASGSRAPSASVPARPASPEWDIEHEDALLPDQDEVIEVVDHKKASKKQVFDIDLDLT